MGPARLPPSLPCLSRRSNLGITNRLIHTKMFNLMMKTPTSVRAAVSSTCDAVWVWANQICTWLKSPEWNLVTVLKWSIRGGCWVLRMHHVFKQAKVDLAEGRMEDLIGHKNYQQCFNSLPDTNYASKNKICLILPTLAP